MSAAVAGLFDYTSGAASQSAAWSVRLGVVAGIAGAWTVREFVEATAEGAWSVDGINYTSLPSGSGHTRSKPVYSRPPRQHTH